MPIDWIALSITFGVLFFIALMVWSKAEGVSIIQVLRDLVTFIKDTFKK